MMSKVKMFTIVDLSYSYYHIDFSETSSFLTSFNTPFGNFRFTKIPFGLTVAGGAFKHKLDIIFNSLDFCTGIAGDMVIWDEEAYISDHDKYLTEFLLVINTTQSKS